MFVPKSKDRYFLFSYRATSDSKVLDGNFWFCSDRFPSNEWLKSLVNKDNQEFSICITGWNEFNSKEDYDNFCGAENPGASHE